MSDESKQEKPPIDAPLEGLDHCAVDKNDEKAESEYAPKANNNDDITEEEENKLLAGKDDDWDVIDCYTEDFDSDMEDDFCRKESKKEKERASDNKIDKGGKLDCGTEIRKVEQSEATEADKDECKGDEKQLKKPKKKPKEKSDAVGASREKTADKILPDLDEPDEDVIQIDDISDTFWEESNSATVATKPEVSLSVKDKMEQERILNEPLVKQIIIPEICISDEEDADSMGSHESLSLQIDHFVEKASDILEGVQGKQMVDSRKDEVKIEPTFNSSGDVSESAIYGCHQEDPDVLQLKLDLYREMGEMDYEQDDKTDEDDEKHPRVRIKQEPSSPPKQRPTFLEPDEIPTIVLTSSEEEQESTSKVEAVIAKHKKKRKKGRSKKKTSVESLELQMVSSEDSTAIVVESTVSEKSIESRVRNDSEGSFDDTGACVRSLRNRTVSIIPEALAIRCAVKKSKTNRKFIDKEMKEPPNKKKKIDSEMIGSINRSESRCSVISASTAASSIPDEDIIVISADDVLLADPSAIEGGMLNIENDCDHQDEPTEDATVCKSANDSKDKLMDALALKEATVNELEQEASISESIPKEEEPEANSFLVPTTDIALEDMLDSLIEAEPNGADKNADVVFHSISPEEKFLMDSLFADCEKQSHQVPSQEYLESLDIIMDDGKPLMERSNAKPISISYTIGDETAQTEVVQLQLNASNAPASTAAELASEVSILKAPHINIIQNYQRYPFQAKPPKKQQQRKVQKKTTSHTKQRGRRGRKKTETIVESDEEYSPLSCRIGKRRSKIKPRQAKLKSPLPVTGFKRTGKDNSKMSEEESEKHVEAVEETQEEAKSCDETTSSSVCRNMPSLAEDLAMTSTDSSSLSIAGDKNCDGSVGTSKEQLCTSPSKISLSSNEANGERKLEHHETKNGDGGSQVASKAKGPFDVRRTGDGLKRKRGRPRLNISGCSTNQHATASQKGLTKPTAKCLSKIGRSKSHKSKISDVYCPTTERQETATATCRPQKESASQQSPSQLETEDKKTTKGPVQRRKHRRMSSSSCSEKEEIISFSNSPSTETEPELQLSASSIASETEETAAKANAEEAGNDLDETHPAADKMDNLQIVLSPLTEKKIRKINTPQEKPKAFAKASQTEISGLTWSSDLDQQRCSACLLKNGETPAAERVVSNETTSSNQSPFRKTAPAGKARSFNDVDMPSRSALQLVMDSPSPAEQQPVRPTTNDNGRCNAEELLFQRALSEVELTSSNSEDRLARQRLERVVNNVRSTFRIPKLTIQKSTSPQVVTSSTPHEVDPNCREDEFGAGSLPTTSRSNDQSEQNRASSSRAAPGAGAGLVQRTITNDYVNDHGEYSNNRNDASRDRQELRHHIMMQDRFEPPVSQNVKPGQASPMSCGNALDSNYLPPSIAENGPQGSGHVVSNQVPQPGPSLSVENRSALPNRSELIKVKRTIRSDISQSQSRPSLQGFQQPVSQPFVLEASKLNPPQQPTLPRFPICGGSQLSYAGGSSSSFNRGLFPCYSGMDIPTMYNGGMLAMQQPAMQQPAMPQFTNPSSNPNALSDFITMFWELSRQLQPPHQQPLTQHALQPPVVSMVPNLNALNQLPALGQVFPQMGQPSAVPKIDPQVPIELSEILCFFFGCIDFLTGKCIKTHCRYSHILPKEEEVYQKLMNCALQNRDAIMATYKFVASRDDLFIKYFRVYATVMGSNNMRHQLVNTITDCEQSKRPIQYYKFIVEGLKMSGISPVQAVQIVLTNHTKKNFDQINVLIELILDTREGIPTFLRRLEEFLLVKDYRFEMVSVNRLLEFCATVELPSNELAVFVSKLLLKVAVGEEPLVNTRALIEFTQKVRLDPELVLFEDDILKKYGRVVMRP